MQKLGLKRHNTVIGLIDNFRTKRARTKTENKTKSEANDGEINPLVALSVLHAIGYTSEQFTQVKNISDESNPLLSIQTKLNLVDDSNAPLGYKRPVMEVNPAKSLSNMILCGDMNPELHGKKVLKASKENIQMETETVEKPQLSGIKLATFVPSLRGGGEGIDSPDKNDKSDGGSGGSGNTKFHNAFSMSTIHTNAAVQSAHLAASQQMQAQHRHNADMLTAAAAALWNEKNRNDLAVLRAQAASVPSIMPTQTVSNMDRYSSMMSTGVQSSNNNSVNVLTPGNLQPQSRPALPQSINGAHEQYLHPSNSSISNHQLHLAQNSLQQTSPVVHSSHLLHQRNTDLNEYFTNNIHQSQVSPNFTTHQNDWAALGINHGLLSTNHPHNSVSHSSIDPSSLGLSTHQAAMLVRERATQVLLARKHQQHQQHLQAQVAAAQRNVALARNASSGLVSTITSGNFIDSNSEGQSILPLLSNKKKVAKKAPNATSGIQSIHDRPTTAPLPLIRPQTSQSTNVSLKVSDQRPSTVPTPPSKSQNSENLLSSVNINKLNKLPESIEKRNTSPSKPNKVNNGKSLQKNTEKEKVIASVIINEKSPQDGKAKPQGSSLEKKSTQLPSKSEDKHHGEISGNPMGDKQETKNVTKCPVDNKSNNKDNKIEVHSKENTDSSAKLKENIDESNKTKTKVSSSFPYTNCGDDSVKSKTDTDGSDISKPEIASTTSTSEDNGDCSITDKPKLHDHASNKTNHASLSSSSSTKSKSKICSGDAAKTKTSLSLPASSEDRSNTVKSKGKANNCDATKTATPLSPSSSKESFIGMRFFIPPHSDKIEDFDADTILKGLFHTVVSVSDTDSKKQALLEYLLAVGSAVPLPKAVVANPLKEKINEASLKALVSSFGGNVRSITAPRQVSLS